MPIAFDAVRDALSASYCLLFAERVTDRQVEGPVVEGVDPAYGDRLQTAAAEHLLPHWLRGLNEGIVIDRAALARDHDFARSDFYNFVIRPEGRFHCLIATPHVTPMLRYHLIVGRPAHYADFTAVESLILRTLLPHVAYCIASLNDAAHATDRAHGLMAAFDSLSDNVAVVRSSGTVVFANAGARRLLALGDGLVMAGPTLQTSPTTTTGALLGAIAAVTSGHGPAELSLECPRPSGCPPYRVTIRRIDADLQHPQTGGHRALVLIQQPQETARLDRHKLAQGFGLTGRELDVAMQLLQGGTLRQGAATLGISYDTARSHLRSLFSKLDVHRQSDLVRKLLGR